MESSPFPNFEIADVLENEWEDSEMFAYLSERRFLLQIFVQDGTDYIYTGHVFLKFTPEQLNQYVKDTWLDFKEKVIGGLQFRVKLDKKGRPKIYNNIQGKTEGQIGLIKLHVKDVVYDIYAENISGRTPEEQRFIRNHTIGSRFCWKPENRDKYGDELPNGDIIPKQSFWLNKEYILEYLRENAPELLKV